MSHLNKILLVEDEENLGMVLRNYLELSGFEVRWVNNGNRGWSAYKSERFDLCLLDVMMPEKDGFSLAKEIREIDENIPLIFLTARGQKKDMLHGYHLGADDYITKPFDSEILILKIKALLNRKKNISSSKTVFQIGKFEFNSQFRTLKTESVSIRLSPKENQLLKMLCEFENDLMPRSLALKKIWKEESYFTARSMDVYITKLRKHLLADPTISIETFHSNGYMLKTC